MAALSIELLGERLAALDARGGGAGAEHGDARLATGVGDAGGERGVGPDDDQPGVHITRQVDDGLGVVGGDGDVGREAGGAAVAGRARDLEVDVAARAGPGQRVLAGPGAGDQDAPRRRAYSHSMVEGGLLEMSYTTRFTPATSLTMRRLMVASTS